MIRQIAFAAALTAIAGAAAALPGQMPRTGSPTETIWHPAPTPAGGTPWAVLESTKEITRTDKSGMVLSKPAFPAPVTALSGKRVRISGYMMPLQNGDKQTHFVLLAYPPDCPFHLNPGPAQFIEVKAPAALPFNYDVRTIEGTLQLVGQDESGIFYKIDDAREIKSG